MDGHAVLPTHYDYKRPSDITQPLVYDYPLHNEPWVPQTEGETDNPQKECNVKVLKSFDPVSWPELTGPDEQSVCIMYA
jgi:hypothetical protein